MNAPSPFANLSDGRKIVSFGAKTSITIAESNRYPRHCVAETSIPEHRKDRLSP